ncbi:hypothetical protein SeMB42_g00320 [Synchytrium endobioticum]|uniref:Uncharacterized protein n=1 Tax=Synchytrium endobioticum TaxID=286115 RepID=A0A507DSV7_9FUNG|nr:hypothetical protein SeLEV6574_g01855 [Synchytrium endobioticum]TPX54342.1 hypothetical protein SeMB42_g00320 [Synchytrium endobioticum]
MSIPDSNLPSAGGPRPTQLGSSLWPVLANAALCGWSTLRSLRGIPGYPNLLASAGFTFLFGGCGYIITQDTNNGQSTALAWGLCYESLFARQAFAAKKPGPIGMVICIGGTTCIYLKEVLTRIAD